MPTVRLAVASTPLTATLDEAVPAAIAAVEEAGRLGAQIVCLPETGLPGHRLQSRHVPDVTQDELDRARRRSRRRSRVARASSRSSVPSARRRPAARSSPSSWTPTARGSASRRRPRSPRSRSRTTSPAADGAPSPPADVTFAIAICHEAYRYPETVRVAAREGAQVVFVPHFVTTEDGSLPERWCDASSPNEEKALLSRALENTVYVAQVERRRPGSGVGDLHHRAGRLARRAGALRHGRRRRPPMSTSPSPTASWPGAGRRSATVWPIRCSALARIR